jgi:hypothetical protein
MSIGERLAVSADFNSLFLRFLRKDRLKTNLTTNWNNIDLAVQTVNAKERRAICRGAVSGRLQIAELSAGAFTLTLLG